MSLPYKRVIATLNNGKSIYVYNMDVNAELSDELVVSGLPEPTTGSNGNQQFKFTHPASGWFCSIGAEDAERLSAVVQVASGDIAAVIKPLRSYSVKDLKSAKPFIGGAK